MNSPLPPDESQRLQDVRRYAILDTPSEASFERLTRLAARLFDVPVAIVNLIDEDRQWFKSCYGLQIRETPREVALCAHTILSDAVLVVPDARQDARFAESPFVTGTEGIRFYAAAPLRSPNGFNLGTFAIMDRVPRELSEGEIATLSDLAALAVDAMELRLAAIALRDEASHERHHAALRLQNSEEDFRSLIENVSDIITVLDADGILRYQSPSLERVLGYEAVALIGTNAFERIHPDDCSVVQEALQCAFENPGLTQAVEHRFLRQDGSWRLMESLGKTLPGSPDAQNVVVISRDITERRQAETELHFRKTLLEAQTEASIEGILVVSDKGQILSWNQRFMEMWGISAQVIAERNDRATIESVLGILEDPQQFIEKVEYLYHHKEERSSDELILRDGRVFERYSAPVRDRSGHYYGRVWYFRDITQRKQYERELQEARGELEERVRQRTAELAEMVEALRNEVTERRRADERLDQFFSISLDMFCIVGIDGQPKKVNPAFQKLLGYQEDELMALSISDIIHPDDRAVSAGEFEKLVNGISIINHSHRNLCKDGTVRWTEWTAVPVPSQGLIYAVGHDITARRASEEKKRFQSHLLDTIGEAVIATDLQGTVIYWNRFAQVLYGWEVSEVTGRNITDLLTTQATSQQAAEIMAGLLEGKSWMGEFLVQRRDGTTFPAQVTNQPIYDADGTLTGIVGISTDISERKQAEEALRESETRFRQLIEQAADAFFLLNRGGRIFDVNQRACESLGYSREELLRSELLDIETLMAREQFEEIWEHLRLGSTITCQGVHRRKDGTTFPVEVRASVLDIGGDQLLFALARDISARKQAEKSLRESEALKSAILNTALDCIITMDHEGKILEWNPAAETTFGYSRDEAVGQLIGKLILSESLREQYGQGIVHYLVSGEGAVLGQRVELPAVRADGSEILVELAITVIPVTEPPVFTAYLRDITARKQAEEAIRTAITEAERANRAKSEFMSRMSHELRTPMNAILGFSQLLEMDDLEAEQAQEVQQILKAGRHLLELIDEVLDIARIESEQPLLEIEPVLVVEALVEVLEMVRPMAVPRDIELRTDWAHAVELSVLADRRRLKQVALNLLSNAVKYNRDAGSVTISCQVKGHRLHIAFHDTGIGIAADKMAQLFTPFARLGAENTAIEGTGLGLVLTRHLVEAMGGTITVQSTSGEGSIFSVELPLAPPSSSPVEPLHTDKVTPRQLARGGETQSVVLYIEDNLSNFGLVQNILRHRPEIKLLAAMQGRLGIELAIEHRPDLILLDVHLPDIDGYEVLRLLREDVDTREIPVIVVSADATSRQIERLMAIGANEYLTKPLDVKRFLQIIEEHLTAKLQAS